MATIEHFEYVEYNQEGDEEYRNFEGYIKCDTIEQFYSFLLDWNWDGISDEPKERKDNNLAKDLNTAIDYWSTAEGTVPFDELRGRWFTYVQRVEFIGE